MLLLLEKRDRTQACRRLEERSDLIVPRLGRWIWMEVSSTRPNAFRPEKPGIVASALAETAAAVRVLFHPWRSAASSSAPLVGSQSRQRQASTGGIGRQNQPHPRALARAASAAQSRPGDGDRILPAQQPIHIAQHGPVGGFERPRINHPVHRRESPV